MYNHSIEQHRELLEKLAELTGRELHITPDVDGDTTPRAYRPVTLKGKEGEPTIGIDTISYGAGKGRIRACIILPRDMWGHSVNRPQGGAMPDTTFDPSRDPYSIAKQLHKLAQDPAYAEALAEVHKRHERHEKRVSAALDLRMALQQRSLKFYEGRFNGEKPDHTGHVELSFTVEDFGVIHVTYAGSYEMRPYNTTASAWRIARAIEALNS